jgi:putative membrane protein
VIGSALLSTLHVFALAIGLPGVFLRGVGLRALRRGEPNALQRVFWADSAWGIAALLWLATGLTRAFGPFEKGSAYYLHNGAFFIKLGLFVAIFLLELWPMVTFVRWRLATSKQQPIDFARVPALTRVNDLELALTLAIPFVASMMARGIGFTLFS